MTSANNIKATPITNKALVSRVNIHKLPTARTIDILAQFHLVSLISINQAAINKAIKETEIDSLRITQSQSTISSLKLKTRMVQKVTHFSQGVRINWATADASIVQARIENTLWKIEIQLVFPPSSLYTSGVMIGYLAPQNWLENNGCVAIDKYTGLSVYIFGSMIPTIFTIRSIRNINHALIYLMLLI